MLHNVVKWGTSNGIQSKSAQVYAHRVIQCTNREEEEAEGQKQKTRTGIIKVSGLIHNR